MGGKPGENAKLQNAQTSLAQQMAATGATSTAEGSQLFNLALPGLEQSEAYYGKLASGDPLALQRANAPAIQGINANTQSAEKNIIANNPKGGERNLALEEANLGQGQQISQLTTGSYLGAFPSLAQLGGQNVSQGNQATSTGVQAENAAANQYGQLQQINNEQKATALGAYGSLGGSLLEAGGEMCWIAMAYWGDFDERTILVRAWLKGTYSQTFIGSAVVCLYRKYGQYVAKKFTQYSAVRAVLSPLFDWFLKKAREEGV